MVHVVTRSRPARMSKPDCPRALFEKPTAGEPVGHLYDELFGRDGWSAPATGLMAQAASRTP